tara:strand:- start:958 stop:1713 length:756 start_codon:yes stop_codon:yes gene_type:complete
MQSDYLYEEFNNQNDALEQRNSNGNFIKLLDNHWQDKFTHVFFSKTGLAISNLSILITMMYFSYSADPADPKYIKACNFQSNEANRRACEKAWSGLVNSQTSAINQRMATICLVGIPAAIYVTLYYTKYMSIVIRAQGTTTFMGMFSTTVGVTLFSGFILRASYCFSPAIAATPQGAFCAKSVDPSFRILNNVLIQLGIMSASTILLIIVSDFIIYKSVKLLWGERFAKFRSYIPTIPIVQGKPLNEPEEV